MKAIEMVARSDTGRVRSNNEDAVAFDDDAAIGVLADGMGGLDGGEVASRLAVDTILDAVKEERERSENVLKGAVESANRAVRSVAVDTRVDMGTTVVACLLTGRGQCFVAHVGDSRVYRIRDGALKRLTIDHSMVQQMIDDGVLSEMEAQSSAHRNVITRALGLEDQVLVDVRSWVHVPGDLFLLCSDGLTDMLTDSEIGAIIEPRLSDRHGALTSIAGALIDGANDAGGHDNVSVLLIRPK